MKSAKPSKKPGDYDVGYAKPPAAHRFTPGKSGNPSGRPKGSVNIATMFRRVLQARVIVVEHGRRCSRSKAEVALTQLANKAAEGNLKAIDMVTKLLPLFDAENNVQAQVDLKADEDFARAFFQSFDPGSGGGVGDAPPNNAGNEGGER
jgi:Family of unknown function (DUF5681)